MYDGWSLEDAAGALDVPPVRPQAVPDQAGTIFHRSRLSLRTWFRAMWWVTNQKTGVSALGLQKLLGLGSYETAWSCLQKLRRAMVRPSRDRLTGVVEVDEAYVGGVEPGGGKRHLGNKALVAIAAALWMERALGGSASVVFRTLPPNACTRS